jgi:orotate phosphoribosyltransferase
MTSWFDHQGGLGHETPGEGPFPGRAAEIGQLTELRDEIVGLVARYGYRYRQEPFRLSSGFWSNDYVDGKRAVGTARRMHLVASAILEICAEEQVTFAAVGGLTMGADPIALAVVNSFDDDTAWFSVRKKEKDHGPQQLIEGPPILPGTKVLLVDDVVTTGRSILEALDAIRSCGAEVVLAVALVDRGEGTSLRLRERDIRYRWVMNYKDLGIEPVPIEPLPASA